MELKKVTHFGKLIGSENGCSVEMPYPELIIMFSLCWEKNILPCMLNKKQYHITNDFFRNLTTVNIAFSLVHPVYVSSNLQKEEKQQLLSLLCPIKAVIYDEM